MRAENGAKGWRAGCRIDTSNTAETSTRCMQVACERSHARVEPRVIGAQVRRTLISHQRSNSRSVRGPISPLHQSGPQLTIVIGDTFCPDRIHASVVLASTNFLSGASTFWVCGLFSAPTPRSDHASSDHHSSIRLGSKPSQAGRDARHSRCGVAAHCHTLDPRPCHSYTLVGASALETHPRVLEATHARQSS